MVQRAITKGFADVCLIRIQSSSLASLHQSFTQALNQTRSFAAPLNVKGYFEDPTCAVKGLLDPAQCVRNLCMVLFDTVPMLLDRGIVLYLLIDQFDQLTEQAQSVVNLIIYRGPSVRHFCKIGVRTGGIHSEKDITGRRLAMPHDISPVLIGYSNPEEKQYLDFIRELTKKRLDEYAVLKKLPKMLTDPEKLFDTLDARMELLGGGIYSRPEDIDLEKKRLESLFAANFEGEAPSEYKILDSMLSRQAATRNGQRYYGGIEQFAILSSGVIRNYLLMCSAAWNQAKQSKFAVEEGQSIPVPCQTVAIVDYAKMQYSVLKSNVSRADEARQLVKKMADEAKKEWLVPKLEPPGSHDIQIEVGEGLQLQESTFSLLTELIRGSVFINQEDDLAREPIKLKLNRIYSSQYGTSPYSFGPIKKSGKQFENLIKLSHTSAMESRPRGFFFSIAFPHLDWHESVRAVVQELAKVKGLEYHEGERHHDAQVIGSDVRAALKEADFAIIDVTDKKPSVFMEYGMAVAAGKPIFLWHNESAGEPFQKQDIPFIIGRVNNYTVVRESIEERFNSSVADFQELPKHAKQYYCPRETGRVCTFRKCSDSHTIFLEGPDRRGASAWWTSVGGKMKSLGNQLGWAITTRPPVANLDICEVCPLIKESSACIIDSSFLGPVHCLHTGVTLGFAFQLGKPLLHLHSNKVQGLDSDWLGIKAQSYGDPDEFIDVVRTWLTQKGVGK
jgi:hypothetical protein